jgi:hypothetical protein
VSVGVEDPDLALADRDERVDLVADFEEHVADLRRPLLAMLGEHVELRLGEDATDRSGHAS